MCCVCACWLHVLGGGGSPRKTSGVHKCLPFHSLSAWSDGKDKKLYQLLVCGTPVTARYSRLPTTVSWMLTLSSTVLQFKMWWNWHYSYTVYVFTAAAWSVGTDYICTTLYYICSAISIVCLLEKDSVISLQLLFVSYSIIAPQKDSVSLQPLLLLCSAIAPQKDSITRG